MTNDTDRDIEAAIQEMLNGGDPAKSEKPSRAAPEPDMSDTLDDLANATPDPDPEPAEGDAPVVGADDGIAAEVEALRKERDELRDRFVRALADAENARKRSDRDRREAENYGGSKLSRDMLPIYDNLSRALESVTEEQRGANTALLEGIELTLRELTNVFSKHGIKRIAPQVGDRFDPKHHEAMFEAPVPGTKAGDIIQVSAEGFMLHDRLLRAAQVGVSSLPVSKG